jgi:hypothetical protein
LSAKKLVPVDGAEPLRRMGPTFAGTTIFVLKTHAQNEFPVRL